MATTVPYDVLIRILDMVTLNGDFATRGKLLLASRDLADYSRTVTHMRLLFRHWHRRGCQRLNAKLVRPRPLSLDTPWLDHVARQCQVCDRTEHSRMLSPALAVHFIRCKYCDRFAYPCTTM